MNRLAVEVEGLSSGAAVRFLLFLPLLLLPFSFFPFPSPLPHLDLAAPPSLSRGVLSCWSFLIDHPPPFADTTFSSPSTPFQYGYSSTISIRIRACDTLFSLIAEKAALLPTWQPGAPFPPFANNRLPIAGGAACVSRGEEGPAPTVYEAVEGQG